MRDYLSSRSPFTTTYLVLETGYVIQQVRIMDSYVIRKNSARCFTVMVTSPGNQLWKPLDSNGLALVNEHCIPNGANLEYFWTVEAEKPGSYELRMIRQSNDGAFRKMIIPIIAEAT